MAITYDVPSNTITVTGYTEGTPCTFLDIWNADQAGGWGVVTKMDSQFHFTCKLKIGDGSTATYFKDTKKAVYFQHGIYTASGEWLIYVYNNAQFQLGELVNETKKTTKNGCFVHDGQTTPPINYYCSTIKGAGGSTIHLYSSTVVGEGTSGQRRLERIARLWNCTVLDRIYIRLGSPNIYNLNAHGAYLALYALTNPTIEKLYATNVATVFYSLDNDQIKNVETYDETCTINTWNMTQGSWAYCINMISNVWHLAYQGAYGQVKRQYTFNLKVIDKNNNPIEGATVTMWDKDETQIFSVSTDASGDIAEQVVSYGYYSKPTGDTLQLYSPHTIQISGAGNQTYKTKYTLDKKVDWQIRLLQAYPVQFLDDNPILQLCPESQEDDRTLFEVF